jgi:hypothetical protein
VPKVNSRRGGVLAEPDWPCIEFAAGYQMVATAVAILEASNKRLDNSRFVEIFYT